VTSRRLNSEEERILRLLLTSEVEEQRVLLAQLPLARVTRQWVEGLPSVDIEVDPSAPRAVSTERVLSLEGQVTTEDGEPSGLILVWLENGALSGIEYAWYSDKPPTNWPDDERISIEVRRT